MAHSAATLFVIRHSSSKSIAESENMADVLMFRRRRRLLCSPWWTELTKIRKMSRETNKNKQSFNGARCQEDRSAEK